MCVFSNVLKQTYIFIWVFLICLVLCSWFFNVWILLLCTNTLCVSLFRKVSLVYIFTTIFLQKMLPDKWLCDNHLSLILLRTNYCIQNQEHHVIHNQISSDHFKFKKHSLNTFLSLFMRKNLKKVKENDQCQIKAE